MAYADIDATHARGTWSPPDGSTPQMIPDRWRDNPGDPIRTDLPDKTDDELVALGWKKVNFPSYETHGAAYYINTYTWNTSTRTYDATEKSDLNKQYSVAYRRFWCNLLKSNVYKTIKTAASTTLATNVIFTEFIALLEDAKRDDPYIAKIQESITELVNAITFTTDERAELQTLFDSNGMSAIYTLP
jgi:hypothetical protein